MNTQFGRKRTHLGPVEDWREYSRRKNEWIRTHPEASAQDIEAAVKEIAKQLGL